MNKKFMLRTFHLVLEPKAVFGIESKLYLFKSGNLEIALVRLIVENITRLF